MCEVFKFVEELAGSASLIQKDGMVGKGPNDTRSDEIEASDLISGVRLVYKTHQQKEEKERQKRTNRINALL